MSAAEPSSGESHDPIAVAAGDWLARRDRGLSAAEQDEFFQWLRADPRHRAALSRLERTWGALDSLAAWQPADGAAPNPDLLAPPRPRRRTALAWYAAVAGFGVAAVLAALLFRVDPAPAVAGPGLRILPPPERQVLADGSVAEPNHGTQLEVAFAAQERRVRLREGEVHVSVVKDAARPFVVEAGGVLVRAIGTAFNVRLERDTVEVLVTDGTVRIDAPARAPVAVTQGERARIGGDGRPVVAAQSAEATARELSWRAERLEFEAMPLRAVVTEFNRRNARQLAIGDAAAGSVKVAGTFRADEPEAFVRLLEAGFGIAVERPTAGAWVLRSAAPKK